MIMKPFNWHCPHCNHKVTITDDLHSSAFHKLLIDNNDGKIGLSSQFIVCPNAECRRPTLQASITKWVQHRPGEVRFVGDVRRNWRLIPFGDARPFPDYVPKGIRQDYEEACLIRDLSPKASATLARRALQGILRGFYRVTPGRLFDEINALEESIEPDVWNAIHAVRKVGNIGAHMQADIDVIVEVDPDEAKLLIELVETMIEETYIRREQRRERLHRVTELADQKDEERKRPCQAIPVNSEEPESGEGEEAAENG